MSTDEVLRSNADVIKKMDRRWLTVVGNRGSLENLEAIRALKRGNFAVGELGEERRLFVGLEMDVTLD